MRLNSLTAPATAQIRRWVISAFPRNEALAAVYDAPLGDPGLFGPHSVTWKVHADFPGMLSGGLCALMLQTLHPLALAGVWDHSNFRTDLVGRLRRTTAFVAGTTYAPLAAAEAMIAQVRRIHTRVRGVGTDGRAYSADDPALLTWVHVTEAYGFIEGYRRYSHARLPADAVDRYYAETRRIAEALGATDVPGSAAEVAAFFAAVQADLVFSERSRIVLDILAHIRLPVPAAAITRNLFLGAGAALLPDWARPLLRQNRRQQLEANLAAATLWGIAPLFRAALTDGIAARACARVGAAPDSLQRWP